MSELAVKTARTLQQTLHYLRHEYETVHALEQNLDGVAEFYVEAKPGKWLQVEVTDVSEEINQALGEAADRRFGL